MYLTIIVLPLLGAISAGLLGRKIGVRGSQLMACLSLVFTAILAIIAFYEVGFSGSPVSIKLFNWIDSEYLLISWGFLFDSLTVSMLLPVLIVSALVHIYSISYMGEDPHIQRFFAYLSMFTFLMLLLVTGDNMLLMFVGWEGVGISSYLLISFWFTRLQATKSALQAILVNRLGDWALSLGLFLIIWIFGNLEFSIIFSLAPFINIDLITIIGFALLIGVMAKSAQFGLHVWLPNAMEGPTPVSAMLHAATMVTAGVYLLMRLSPLIEYSSTVLVVITWLGAISAFIAASIGLVQNDIKKIIAYSTASQLGYMVLACGLSNYNIALFHLINHAYFKALLFLAAGSVIHAMHDEQDIRKYGGLAIFLPLSYVMILIGSLSLVAFPFLTGFYSKELIISAGYAHYTVSGHFAYWLSSTAAIFTAMYSVRLIYLTFISQPNGVKSNYESTHEAPLLVNSSLGILALFSIFFGYFTHDIFAGIGSSFLGNSVFIHPNNLNFVETEFSVPTLLKLLPLIGSIIGSIIVFVLYEYYSAALTAVKLSNIGMNLYKFLNQKYWVDLIYSRITVSVLNSGYITNKIIDKGVLEILGPTGLSKSFYNLSNGLSSLDTQYIPTYGLYIILSLVTLTGIVFYLNVPRLLILFIFSLLFLNNGNSNKN